MKPAEQIALWADKLRDISATALLFTQNPYDREHFQQVRDVAMAMLALANGESLEEMEPSCAPLFSLSFP